MTKLFGVKTLILQTIKNMKLPINIEELLSGRAVEGDRIEYKIGWNPDVIYRNSFCVIAIEEETNTLL